jgi:hypothetical protein
MPGSSDSTAEYLPTDQKFKCTFVASGKFLFPLYENTLKGYYFLNIFYPKFNSFGVGPTLQILPADVLVLLNQTKPRGFGPRANYANRADCSRS